MRRRTPEAPGAEPALTLVSIDGSTTPLFALAPGEWINNTPMPWTPDGKHLLVRKMLDPSASKSELWLVPVNGDAPRRIAFDVDLVATYAPGKIRLSPDGRRLAYVTGSPGNVEVVVVENFLPGQP